MRKILTFFLTLIFFHTYSQQRSQIPVITPNSSVKTLSVDRVKVLESDVASLKKQIEDLKGALQMAVQYTKSVDNKTKANTFSTGFQASCGGMIFKTNMDADAGVRTLPFAISLLPEQFYLTGFDDGNNFNNHIYTIPSNGVYHFDVSVNVVWAEYGSIYLYLEKLPNYVIGINELVIPPTPIGHVGDGPQPKQRNDGSLIISITGRYEKGDQLIVKMNRTIELGDKMIHTFHISDSQWSGYKVY